MPGPSTQNADSHPVASRPTPRERRTALINQIEAKRGGRALLAYVTSTRPGFEVQMADDVLPFIHQGLEAAKEKAKNGVDLFIHSNGGHGTTPWRIVNLIREYTKEFAVLVPNHAFSAATLLALGADKIIMHKMGCLGPIDPSVANAFNPTHPQNPGRRVSTPSTWRPGKLAKNAPPMRLKRLSGASGSRPNNCTSDLHASSTTAR
jgi:hypothetical protein